MYRIDQFHHFVISIDPINFDLLVGDRLVFHMLSTGMCVEKYRPTKLSEIFIIEKLFNDF